MTVPRRRIYQSIAGLWALTLLAYSNSFGAGFVFDNFWAILQDTRLRAITAENLKLILTQDYWFKTTNSGLYRPLTTLTYLVNYSILGGGANPAPYHLVNFALHALNATLLYLLAGLLLDSAPLALAIAALWAVHPVLTESVTNIVGRADLLAAFGVLAGLLLHIRAALLRADRERPWRWLLGLAAASTIAVCSKESGVLLLAAMAIYDLAYRSPFRWRAYAAAGAPAAIFFYVHRRVVSSVPVIFPFTDNPVTGADFLTAKLTALEVMGKSIGLLFWPAKLSSDYSYRQIPLFDGHLTSWLLLAVPLVCAAAGLACYRKQKPVFFFAGLGFAALLPTSNLLVPIGSIMAERFLYVPAMAFAACLVIAAHPVAGRMPHAGWGVLGLACAALAARTFVRNFDWADDLHLSASAVAAAPESYKTHLNLAAASGISDLALREAARSLEIVADLPGDRRPAVAYTSVGQIYRRKGDSDPAGPWYRKSLDVLLLGREAERAELEIKRQDGLAHGMRIGPCCHAPLYKELGITELRLGDARGAIEALEYGRVLRPDDLQFTLELAHAWKMAGDRNQAAVALMEGVTLDMNEPAFVQELTKLYGELDPEGCALVNRGGNPTINPDCPLVRGHICEAAHQVSRLRFATGETAQAIAIARGAMRDFGCAASMFQ